MTRPRIAIRPLLTTLTVVAALLGSMPSAGAKPLSDAGCIRYSGIAGSPKGKIPRDDLHSVRVDPVTRWMNSHPSAAREAAALDGTVTVPVAFHVLRKDTTIAGGNAPLAWIQA